MQEEYFTHAFFFSDTQKSIIEEYREDGRIRKFNGAEYTEMKMFKYGISNFPDAILLGFGSMRNVS